MKKRILSLFCIAVMLFSFYSFMIPVYAETNSGEIIEGCDVPLRLHYDEETPYGNENAYQWPSNIPNDGWDKWSLPKETDILELTFSAEPRRSEFKLPKRRWQIRIIDTTPAIQNTPSEDLIISPKRISISVILTPR